MSQPYHYEPLNEGEIRLLTVSLNENEPYGLTLSLRSVVLDGAKGSYIALSYTWGRPEPLHLDPTYQPDKMWELKCDGRVIKVRQNLFDFLQQVKRTGSDVSSLWIDAVCIDQQNDTEKSEQVLRMGQIYASSLHVWIWLGSRPMTLEVRQIIYDFIPAMLKDFKDRDLDRHPGFYKNIDILNEKSSRPIIQNIGYDKWAMWKSSWRQYSAFFDRTWFRRGWTVQEAALQASDRCSVLVGSDIFPWSLILSFCRLWEQSGWDVEMVMSGPEDSSWVHMAMRVGAYDGFQMRVQPGIGAATLKQQWHAECLRLLMRTSNMSVEDPRDHIYAYLGIMLQNKPPCVENSIFPDYTVDDVVVYRNFATVMLQNVPGRGMLGLTQTHLGRRNPKLPSWVPDFSSLPVGPPERYYNTSKSRRDGMNIPEIRGDYLTIRGAQFTSVSSHDLLDSLFTDPRDRLAAFSLYLGNDVGTGQCMPEAIWRSVFADHWTLFDTKDQPLRPRIRQWLLRRIWYLWHFGRVRELLPLLLAPVTDDEHLVKWLPTLQEVKRPDVPGRDDDFDQTVDTVRSQRELYRMASGNVGVGPRSLCDGDQVWILEGGEVPFVLRQKKDGKTYTLLGYMYVHGIMHGEAMTDEFRSRFGPVTIV